MEKLFSKIAYIALGLLAFVGFGTTYAKAIPTTTPVDLNKTQITNIKKGTPLILKQNPTLKIMKNGGFKLLAQDNHYSHSSHESHSSHYSSSD